ncbi:TNT domain-containing protein [Actinophytocola glycyrrhizae]|uniref:TNT domain-containing protein n=1 Tax=Actinophytocola glycyrrhizae TaxID=2044873 RepID=A0ABV9RYT4_9PSEU
MAQPTQLTPTEQDALVKQIGLAMLRVAPEDWEQLTVDYRAVGRYAESTGLVTYSDGGTEPWTMPADLQGLFARLRAGMYREGRGTWFNARYKLDHPSSYNLEYDREEPTWDAPPPPQAYPDDMRLFPRTDDNVPEWLRRRLATAPPPPGPPPGTPMPDRAPGPPRFRVARIFDGPGEDGRPSVNRPQVDEMDIQDILDYLDNGPLVGPARGYDIDRLDPNGQQSVPVAFHTDGTWIWPAAVNYYLREHDVAPEPDLVEHIRRMRFQLPPVDDQTRAAAQQFLGPPPPGPRPGPPPAPAPTRAMPVPAPVPAPKMPPATPPRAALPSQGPASAEIDHLRTRLDDLDVPETAYRIGKPAGRGWTMEQTDEGWRVGWHDQDWVAPAVFEDVADASAFLLGKLMLDTDRWAAGPKNPELPPLPPPPPDHGFEPPAPAADYEPMSAPMEEFTPGGGREAAAAGSGRDFASAGAGRDFGGPGAGRDFGAPNDFASAGAGRNDFGGPGAGRDAGSERDFGSPGDFASTGSGQNGGRDFGSHAAGRNDFAPPDTGQDDFGGTGPGRDFGSPGDFASTGSGQNGGRDFAAPGDFVPGGSGQNGGRDFGSHAAGRNDFAPPDTGQDDFGGTGPGRDFAAPGAGQDEFSSNDFGGRDEFGTRIVGPPPGTPGFTPPSPSGPVGPPPGTPGFSPPPGTPPRGEPAHTMAMEPPSPPRGEQQATVLAPRPTNGAASAPPGSEWPITPLPGEPPLTLFRGKRMIELEPGAEFDRFGDDDGNLVYAVGTPFTERSLVPEWVDRPYHVYRVRQPVQVLTGAAIPWFDQPGGGTAYLLPDAVGELVAHGAIVEVDSGEPPRS